MIDWLIYYLFYSVFRVNYKIQDLNFIRFRILTEFLIGLFELLSNS